MAAAGVERLYAKRLAPNDNSKNQIYLGSDFEMLNILPNRGVHAGGAKILRAALDFLWMTGDGKLGEARGAQLILYPQYPEVRMSGFLRGCRDAPSTIMTSRDSGRVLFIGVRGDGKLIGFAAAADSVVAKELEDRRDFPQVGVFIEVPLRAKRDSRLRLLAELRRIHLAGWIDSKRLLAPGEFGPCAASNCGGYTLEAEMGILPNSLSEPDFEGWELKQFKVARLDHFETGVLTLMTPEPTGGYYRERGVEAFIRRFGYTDKRGRPDRMNFGGIHRVGAKHAATRLTLTLEGYEKSSGKISDVSSGVFLIADDGEVAAAWKYDDLMTHWNRKHARAAYVPSVRRSDPRLQYRYGSSIRLGEGTDFLLFLKALAKGVVYYDPGIKLERASSTEASTKRRSQFRVKSRDLSALYNRLEALDLAEQPSPVE